MANINYIPSDVSEWDSISTLPYNFYNGSAVVYNNKIHILGSGSSNDRTKHYSWDGTDWVEESTLPYIFYSGSAVVYNNKIHILGANYSGNYTKHYSWDGTDWVEESTLPYNFYNASAVVYNNKIHILGSAYSYDDHYSWDGTNWVEESTLPYNFYGGSAVVYDGKIHILGSNSYGSYGNDRIKHYSWDGTNWVEESMLPYVIVGTCAAVVYSDRIYMFADESRQYAYYIQSDQTQIWERSANAPYAFSSGSAVVYDGKIHILGSSYNSSLYKNHYSETFMFYTGANKVVYGNQSILDLTNDTINDSNHIMPNYIGHDKSGKPIRGTATSDADATAGEIVESATAYVNGVKLTGTRPPYYEKESKQYIDNFYSINLILSSDATAFTLGGQTLILRNPSGATGTARLVSIKSDGTTESTVDIKTGLAAGYQETFKITNVKYIDKWTAQIIYEYQTAASAAANSIYCKYTRTIHIKNDGTLYQYTEYAVSGTWSSGYSNIEDGIMIPTLFGNRNADCLIFYRYYTNQSTYNLTIQYKTCYMQQRSNTIDISYMVINNGANLTNASVKTRVSFPTEKIKAKGGILYMNNSGVPCIYICNKYHSDYQYPINGTVDTFVTDGINADRLKINIISRFETLDLQDTLYRNILILGLLSDNTTMVTLRWDFQSMYTSIYLDFWELNLSAKVIKWKATTTIVNRRYDPYTNNVDGWTYADSTFVLKYAYLKNDIFYYGISSSRYRYQLFPDGTFIELSGYKYNPNVQYHEDNLFYTSKSPRTDMFEEVIVADSIPYG